MKRDLAVFQQSIGTMFKDEGLLRQALVHSSYLNENPGFVPASYERMEFLGDAVLGLIVGEKLFRECPVASEGELTRLRSELVRRETLAKMAREIHLDGYLYLGKGEESGGGRAKELTLASSLEALIGAIFLDHGITASRRFILKLFQSEITRVLTDEPVTDYKSKLQQIIQSNSHASIQPVYQVTSETGPAHSPVFNVIVKAGEKVLGKGSGKSKKAAETEAARQALGNFET